MRNQASQLNAKELRKDIKENTSWHDPYRNSPHIYIGGIPFELNEGDILTVFAQYGRIKKINLMRDKETQKSKGFAFISYENPKSSVLAVDNFDGIEVSNLFELIFILISYAYIYIFSSLTGQSKSTMLWTMSNRKVKIALKN